jgi:hypothetical protein
MWKIFSLKVNWMLPLELTTQRANNTYMFIPTFMLNEVRQLHVHNLLNFLIKIVTSKNK